MSEEEVRRSKEHDNAEIDISPGAQGQTHKSDSESSFPVKTPAKKRRSRYDELEEKFEQRFSSFENNFEKIFSLLQPQTADKSKTAPSRQSRLFSSDDESDIENLSSQNRKNVEDDVLSLHDKRDCSSESDSDCNDPTLSEKTKKCLYEIFGDDAKVSKNKTEQIGMAIDDSQKEVLLTSYRSSNPSYLTSYSEDVIDLFPVNKETEEFLQVPPIDPLIESCLIKRHGSKAAFSSSKARGKGLYTQPCKMVERIAYKGSHAARLGVIIQLYVQQSLGNLLQTIQSDFDKEKIEKQVKDIFSMTTKGLDQIGRAGAFHQIIRRTLSMTDTGLYDLSDSSKFMNLPLTGDGLFGSELENLLKTRKEQRKQIEDLVPDIPKKETLKRKAYSATGHEPSSKKASYEKPSTATSSSSSSGNLDNFRIPKLHKPRDRNSTFQERKIGVKPSQSTGSTRPSGRGRGRADRK